MQAKVLVWLGTRTFDDTVRFFKAMLGLRMEHEGPVFRLPNGYTVEVFGSGDRDHEHFTTVVGFLVDDVREARKDLEGAGISFIGPAHEAGGSWSHFTAPEATSTS